ncbi:MAG: DUF2079 domain-containing protein [Myxococcaceae bacterium]|nr:DUF2079 domain-containing protein [Myxococcaceae bacterium]
MLVRSARAAISLGLISAAIMHAIATELVPVDITYFTENLLAPEKRKLVLALMAAAFFVVALTTLTAIRRDRTSGSPEGAEWLARLLCPALVLPIALTMVRHSWAEEGIMAIVLAMFALALERLMREAAGAWAERPPGMGDWLLKGPRAFFARPRLVLGVLIGLATAHMIYMALWAVFAHMRFATYGYDLGQYDQVFQSVMHGRPLRLPSLGWDQNWGGLNGHADFASFYMLPLYLIHPRAETLLVMQACAMTYACIPAYLFAKNRLPIHFAFAFGLAWILYPALHNSQLYDVHMQPFGMSWVMWAIAMAELRRFKTYWLFFVFAILCREDVSIGLATLGAFMWLSGWRPKTGFVSAVIATAYFLVLRFVLMGNQMFAEAFKLLYPPGEAGFVPVVKTIISNPGYTLRTIILWEKIRYVCQVFAPLVFLPLRRPLHWLLFVPGFLLTLIATAYMPPIQISFQYVCNWIAYAFAAAAMTLSYLDAKTPDGAARRAAGAWALLIATAVGAIQWGAYGTYGSIKGGFGEVPFKAPSAADLKRKEDLLEVMKSVPDDYGTALCAADRLQAHVTWHQNTWSLRDGLYDCEYLLFSTLPGDNGNVWASRGLSSGQYEVILQKGEILLAKRKPKQ